MAKREKDDCGCGCLPLQKIGKIEPKSEAKKSKKSKK